MALLMCCFCFGSWLNIFPAARQAVIVGCFAVQGTQQQPQRPQLPPSLAELYPHLMPRPAQQHAELPPPAAVSAIYLLLLQPLTLLLLCLTQRTIQRLQTVTYFALHGMGMSYSFI